MQNQGIRSVFQRSDGWLYECACVCHFTDECFKQNFNALFSVYFLTICFFRNMGFKTKLSEISELIHGHIHQACNLLSYCIQWKEWQSIICVAFDSDLLSNKTALKINTICKLFTVNACTNMHTRNHWAIVGVQPLFSVQIISNIGGKN